MATILIKDMPADLKKRLQDQAERNRRSMVQEAIVIIERELRINSPINMPPPVKPSKPISKALLKKALRSGRR